MYIIFISGTNYKLPVNLLYKSLRNWSFSLDRLNSFFDFLQLLRCIETKVCVRQAPVMPFFLVRQRVAAAETIWLLQIGLLVALRHANKIISLFIWWAIILAFALRFCNYNNNFIMEGLTIDEKQQLIKATGITSLTQKGKSPKCTKTKNKRPRL